MGRGGWTKSDCLEKIFYTQYIQTTQTAFAYCGKVKKVILVYPIHESMVPECMVVDSAFLYVNSSYLPIIPNTSFLRCANVSYYYNYDLAPHYGYYWIDDYDYGETITFIPNEPTRDGYKFGGWYKESECINKWHFKTDVLPPIQLDIEGNIIYQETKLYAKWIKN